jgi:AraC family transcriptional regulator
MIQLKAASYLGKVQLFKEESGLIASVTTYPDADYAERLHTHETLHLSLVLTGGNLEKRINENIERTAGVVTFYRPGEPHQSTLTRPGSKHVNLEITDHFLHRYGYGPDTDFSTFSHWKAGPGLMLNIYKEVLMQDEYTAVGIEGAITNLLSSNRISDDKRRPAWLDKIIEILQDKWNEWITLEELAHVAEMHPVNLSSNFSRLLGYTISEYRRKVKVDKAVALIQNQKLSLSDIAYQCNFSDQSHFNRTFRQFTGWTPKSYRKQILGT